ncbi:hypothetical protein NQ315_005268 [Exocentrus adspersus]|uniref:Glycoprotein endo-alpha-1,2-mannosidase n=1 Tax=Exocentrus adspersus TaxID=1586481 RepID=A0AAV8W137_9CUCU|nr:hypothetical protein NQ315_005268 [Exocentrus adspersus]
MRMFIVRKYYLICILIAAVVTYMISTKMTGNLAKRKYTTAPTYFLKSNISKNDNLINTRYVDKDVRNMIMEERIKRLEEKHKRSKSIVLNSEPMAQPNYNIHTFYYAWYGNVKVDKEYKHWNHKYIENWKKDGSKKYPSGKHKPPFDIGSNYYPYLGCYSSADLEIINTHLKQISESGIGVIVVSWTPANFTDSPSDILPNLFNAALKYNVKVAIHVEPYTGRNPINLLSHLKQFFSEYGGHPSLYRIKKPLGNKMVPVIYIYDSYLIPAIAWKELFSTKGNLSVRNTPLDAIYLGLLVDVQHKSHIKKSQFDGFYTYFATNSFTYGSTWKNWQQLSKFAVQNGLIFVPSIGPGYIDTRVRPWNMANTRHRRHGQYYDVAWRSAINSKVNYISITSFNEWHEGTQIEPARPRNWRGFSYLDYEPEGAYYYLNLTKSWIQQFQEVVD